MKRIRSLVLPIVLLATAVAASAQSSVWKVTRAGRALYLGGTCHTLRPSDLPIPEEYSVAFDAASTLVFETDIAQMQSAEMQGRMLRAMVFSDGSKLSSVISTEAWAALQEYATPLGYSADTLETFRPPMITILIFATEAQRLGFTPEGVDVQLDRRARATGKTISTFETPDEQVALIAAMGAGQESELILSTLRDLARIPTLLDEMVAAWRSGDLEKVDTLTMAEMRREFPKLHEDLMVKRNQAWLPKIETMLADAPVEFVLVGVGHLAGEDGIIAALKKSGCTIEQVRAAR
jgi:uncharacterized protein YbaP (TraB family)